MRLHALRIASGTMLCAPADTRAADSEAALDVQSGREPDGVLLTVGAHRGTAQLEWRWCLPAGEAVSVMRATPQPTTLLDGALHDLAEQFDRYREACGFLAADCVALTLLVTCAEHVQAARAVGRRLCARVRVVLMRADVDAQDAVQLIAAFSKRLA